MKHHSRRQVLRRVAGLGFGVTLAWASGCWALPPQLQRSAEIPRVGFLAAGSLESRAFMIDGFREGLRELGYVEGQNVALEYGFSDGRDERLPELAADLVNRKVDVLVVSGTTAAFAAARTTSTTPIVMGAIAADPVATGLIASLARPGGNVTGIYFMSRELAGKRLELLKEIVPGLSRVAVLSNPTVPTTGPVLQDLEVAAQSLVVQLQRLEVRSPEDLEPAVQAGVEDAAQALIIPADPMTSNRPAAMADLAMRYRLPATMELRQFADASGLMYYGPDIVDAYRRSATHVDKILRGARPAELPVEQATRFELIINLKAAQALGLTIPESVLLQATEIIH
jgi:putative ABC transport system substrate-binding protein